MGQQSQQQGGGGGDNSLAPAWITALVFITLYFVWAGGHTYITALIFKINILQGKLITLFYSTPKLEKDIYLMQTLDPSTVNWSQLMNFTQSIGNITRYPVVILLIVLAFMLYQSNIKLKYRKAHSMKTLKEQEQNNWPAIMPTIKENLIDMDVSKGPWAMAMTPVEFARRYQLLKKEDAILDTPTPDAEMTAGIRRGDAKRVFTLQLGPYWDGFQRCAPHVGALAAVFMARMNRDRGSAAMILENLNKGYLAGKMDYSVAWPVLKKHQNVEIVQEVFATHAYLLTVMATLLEKARDDGVVSVSEFLWVKPIDRRLWYMLNCVGRQTPYVEISGPFAHWKAEKAMGRRSLMPMIDEAIRALEVAVKEVKLKPKELQELES